MEQRITAFWENSTGRYPGILSGEVVKFQSGGRVLTKEYPGMYFNPIMILPYDEGLKVQKKLRDLAEEYQTELDNLNKRFKDKLSDYTNIT